MEPLELYTAMERLGVAALVGLAVGVEREWSAKQARGIGRFGGVRTFLLLGLLGGLAAELLSFAAPALAVALLAGGLVLVLVAYGSTAWRGEVDATTEVAGLVVLGAGMLAGLGELALASAVAAVCALVLVAKSRLHSWVDRIRSEELEAGLRFAVLASVVLPLLPKGPFGPAPGIFPQRLWALVLVFSGLSFLGFVALRAAGPTRGYGLAGLLGGLISSTAVTLNFARESRAQPDFGRALGFGVLAACTLLPVRVVVLASILNPAVGLATLPYLVLPFLVGAGGVFRALRRPQEPAAAPPAPKNPLRLAAAIEMVLLFQVVYYAVHWVGERFGATGVRTTAAVLGLHDLDALTYSMTRLSSETGGVALAAQALAIGVLSNTVAKLVLAVTVGRGTFARVAGVGLAVLAAASAVALLVVSSL